jgi:hypothetical protein
MSKKTIDLNYVVIWREEIGNRNRLASSWREGIDHKPKPKTMTTAAAASAAASSPPASGGTMLEARQCRDKQCMMILSSPLGYSTTTTSLTKLM